jgi:hypothetical protein
MIWCVGVGGRMTKVRLYGLRGDQVRGRREEWASRPFQPEESCFYLLYPLKAYGKHVRKKGTSSLKMGLKTARLILSLFSFLFISV